MRGAQKAGKCIMIRAFNILLGISGLFAARIPSPGPVTFLIMARKKIKSA